MTEAEQNSTFFATQIAQIENQQEEQPSLQAQHKQVPAQQQQPQPQISIEKPEIYQPIFRLKQLLQIFNSYDKSERGLIELEQSQMIIADKLGSRQTLSQQVAFYHHLSQPSHDHKCTFDEFLFIFGMYQVNLEKQSIDQQYSYGKTADPRLIDFMRLLNNYRKKCERQSFYKEAKKSKSKVEEIRQKQYNRRKKFLNILNQKELQDLQATQKQKFEAFCSTWDEFMAEYEATATDLVQKLRQKQRQELNKFIQKTKEELASKMHYSRNVIELQALQKNLVKAQQYQKAEKVKLEIQQTKYFELQKKQKDDLLKLQMRVDTLKKQHQSSLSTLLQKIQKDRNDQTRQRMSDAQKLIVKNKTLVTDLKHRHTEALKKLFQALHNITLDESRLANSLSASQRAKAACVQNQNTKQIQQNK